MDIGEAIALRKRMGLTQTELADLVGMNMRSWQEIEAGRTKLKRIHVLALERVALSIGVEQGNPMITPTAVRREALELARIIAGA